MTSDAASEPRETSIEIRGVTHHFTSGGRSVQTLDDVSISIPQGQFVSVVGPSGCGKTTVMNMVAGLVTPSSGTVTVGGRPRSQVGRDVGYMFARDGLLPWRTARQNVELGLELRKVRAEERHLAPSRLLAKVGLSSFADYYPKQLSQGMRQRVAVARTLALDPDLFLLDEPFAALDAQTRVTLQNEFLSIWEGLGNTVMFVTHDLDEAIALADRVIVFSGRPGRVKLDIPIDLPRPRDVATIRFDPEFRRLSELVWDAMEHDTGIDESTDEVAS